MAVRTGEHAGSGATVPAPREESAGTGDPVGPGSLGGDAKGPDPSGRLLRTALWLDAVLAAGTGVILVPTAGLLAAPLGLSHGLLLGIGWFMTALGVVLALVAAGWWARVPAVRGVIAFNLLWVLASAALLLPVVARPSAWGVVAVAGQAVVVVAITTAEVAGLRRRGRSA